MPSTSTHSSGNEPGALSADDAQLIKTALATAAANGCLPEPFPVSDSGVAAADAQLVQRLAHAFAEVNRLTVSR